MPFGRMIECTGTIVVPAIFLAQRTDDLNRVVGSKLLPNETDVRAGEHAVDQPLEITADAVSGTALRIQRCDALAELAAPSLVMFRIHKQRVLGAFTQSGMNIDCHYALSR